MIALHDPRRQDLAAAQLDRLRALLAELGANRFYAPRLRHAGLLAADGAVTLTALADLSRLPVTTKAELVADQAAHPPYGSDLSYPLARYSRFHQTSGTTSAPLRWLDTPESWQSLLDCWQVVYDAAAVSAADRVCFAFSFGPFLGFWTAFEAATQRGCLCLPGGGLSSAARLQAMLANAVTVLCCTPTYALRLAEAAHEAGVSTADIPLRRIIVAGEPGGSVPGIRARIEAHWPGARVVDHHGMTEVGPVSVEDPRQTGHLRVIETHYLAEVVDPASGAPVPPGGEGELLLTTLRRAASPLLRYRTGDRVRPVLAPDGGLLLAGGILGRSDDMLLVRGVNLYPAAVDEVIARELDVAEYRVHVIHRRGMLELSIALEPTPRCSAPMALVQRLQQALRNTFNLRVEILLVEPDSLPRQQFKSRRWVVERDDGL